MSSLKSEELLSDVEPLPPSLAQSPPACFLSPLLGSPSPPASPPTLTRSWPPSPLATLPSSSRVTARLYASLRSAQGLGLSDFSTHTVQPRHVRFKVSTSDDAPVSKRTTCLDTPSPSFLVEREEEPVGGSADTGHSDLELGDLAEQMSGKLQASLDTTSSPPSAESGRQHIEDMENVRNHLQTMLRVAHDSTKREEGITYLTGISLLEGHRKDNESFDSDTTSHLLGAPLLADISPSLSVSGLDELFPRYSRLQTDGILASSEVQLLRDGLDRERTRRKQCEKQIQILQNKVLHFQQQVALAVSADRKKDIMIEQLDKTLAKVVEGWKKHEEEKSEGMKQLQEEKEAAERTQAKQQEMLAHFEQSLSQAAETLDREQKQREELKSTNQQLQQQLAELHRQLEDQGCQFEKIHIELQEAQKEALEARSHLIQHREVWSCKERELEERLAVQHSEIDEEKAHRERAMQQLREAQREAHSALSRLQQYETELEEARRERDSVRMDRALDQARFEAQRSQLEVELKLSVEQQVTERLAALQKDNAEMTASLREEHRKQVQELMACHKRELSAQLAQFRAELQQRDDSQRELVHDYERRLVAAQHQLLSLQSNSRKLEQHRTELVSQLQKLMRSHWAEALRLLAPLNQTEGSIPPIFERDTSSMDGTVEQSSLGVEPSLQVQEVQEKTAVDLSQVLSSPEHRLDVPRAVMLHMCREKVPQLDVSGSFAPLEPQLDDTGVKAQGSFDTVESPPWHSQHREHNIQREAQESRCSVEVHQMNNRTESTGVGGPSCPENLSLSHCQDNSLISLGCRADRARGREVPRGPSMELGDSLSRDRWCPSGQEAGRGVGLTSHLPSTGSLKKDDYNTAASTSQRARQAELQHYVAMLLDRPPGDPLEPPVKGACYPSTSRGITVPRASDSTQTDLRGLWDSKRAAQPEGAAIRPPSSAVTKGKLRPLNPPEMTPSNPEPSCLFQVQAGATLTTAQLAQVSQLLTQLRSRADIPTSSLDELVAYMLSGQVDRSLVLPDADREQKLHQSAQKEGVPSAPQHHLLPHMQRTVNSSRSHTQGPKGRRAGSQAQRGPSARQTAWR